MIIRHRGFEPQIDHSVFVAPTAVVCGKVGIGKDSRAVRAVGFVKAAYGVEADWKDGGKRYRKVTEAMSKELKEHFSDIILDK